VLRKSISTSIVLAASLALSTAPLQAGDIRTDGKLVSTVDPGTPPLEVLSPTWIENLNADRLDGADASAFAPWDHGHPELDPPAQVTVTVDCGGGETIADALETPAEELIIEVSGLCHELLHIVGRRVVIRGTDPTLDGIRPPAGATDYFALVQIDYINFDRAESAPGVVLENLSISESAANGVRVFFSDVDLVNTRVENNAFIGVGAAEGSYVEVYDSVIAGNGLTGARARSAGWLTLDGCTVSDNGDSGINGTLAGVVVATETTITGSPWGAISGWHSSVVAISSSTVSGSRAALYAGAEVDVRDSILEASLLVDEGGSVFLSNVTQTALSEPYPGFPEDAYNLFDLGVVRIYEGTTLLGTTWVNSWSRLRMDPGTLMDGDLICGTGGDAWCSDASQISGSIGGCELCPPATSSTTLESPSQRGLGPIRASRPALGVGGCLRDLLRQEQEQSGRGPSREGLEKCRRLNSLVPRR
jgi:hypothetical protein